MNHREGDASLSTRIFVFYFGGKGGHLPVELPCGGVVQDQGQCLKNREAMDASASRRCSQQRALPLITLDHRITAARLTSGRDRLRKRAIKGSARRRVEDNARGLRCHSPFVAPRSQRCCTETKQG